MSVPVILVIDDEVETVEFVRAVFQRRGKQVIGARTGSEGLALAQAHQPAVILIDLRLPEKSGFEVCRELCVNPMTAHIPKVILSASMSIADQSAASAAGAEQYLLKPVGVKLLVSVMDGILSRTSATQPH